MRYDEDEAIDKAAIAFEASDPKDILAREVFARFGKAVYLANCLERTAAAALLHLEWRANLRAPMTRREYESEYDAFQLQCSKQPMGLLVGRLLKRPELDDSLRDALSDAVGKRNHLAHHYFWERAGEFMIVPHGQLSMIAECDESAHFFEVVDAALVSFLKPFIMAHGVTPSVIEREGELLRKAAFQRLGGVDATPDRG